jgi:hypothetical protein
MADNDEVLLGKINAAVADHNAAEKAVTTARSELVSKSKVVGHLLLEAKNRHPKVADFESFLKRVNGLKLSRAYDLLRLAGGRTTDEELRQDARERKQKSRAKKKLPPKAPSLPKPEPDTEPPLSVTDPPVTESPERITQSPEISVEDRRAQNAALDTEPKALELSRMALNSFKAMCRQYLRQLTEEDWASASVFFEEYALKRSQEALRRKVA